MDLVKPARTTLEAVKEAAYNVLTKQRVTVNGHRFTTPSAQHSEYVGRQWFWDSCFHAYILAKREPEMAEDEIRSLLFFQREDGFIPHINYFRGDAWQVPENFKEKLSTFWSSSHHSDLLQPPILALAVRQIFQHTQNETFLREVVPKLERYYHFLHTTRNRAGDGLLSIIHSWESGWDNSQRWDTVYQIHSGRRVEIDEKKMALFKQYQEAGWNIKKIFERESFNVKPVDFNALYAQNTSILATLCSRLGRDGAPFLARSRQTTNAIFERMQHNNTFYDLLADGTRLGVQSAAMFFPMLLEFEFDYAGMLQKYLSDGQAFSTRYGVPTTPPATPLYAPDDYWRGNVWINVNWFVIQGLIQQEKMNLALQLALNTVDLVRGHGFWEYYNPHSGAGHGAPELAWCSLVYDMVEFIEQS